MTAYAKQPHDARFVARQTSTGRHDSDVQYAEKAAWYVYCKTNTVQARFCVCMYLRLSIWEDKLKLCARPVPWIPTHQYVETLLLLAVGCGLLQSQQDLAPQPRLLRPKPFGCLRSAKEFSTLTRLCGLRMMLWH
jgi:hypothetical protein